MSAAALCLLAALSWLPRQPAAEPGSTHKGGTVAEMGELPFAVLVLSRYPDYGTGHHTGAILTRDWVLTGAGAVIYRKYASDVLMELDARMVSISACWKTNLTMSGLRITMYEYMKEYGHGQFDRNVAVLKMATPWEWSPCIGPSLLSYKESFLARRPCLAVGFGERREGSNDQGILRQVRVIVSKCWKLDPRSKPSANVECLQSIDKFPGVCQGDAGGQVVCRSPFGNVQVGVICGHPLDCTRSGKAAFFIPALTFKPWLESIVGNGVFAPYGSEGLAPKPEPALVAAAAAVAWALLRVPWPQ